MPFYRWEDYQCTNAGQCPRADRHDVIDLPRGAEPFCPACARPLAPLRARELVLVSPPGAVRCCPAQKRPLRLGLLAASGALLALALTGGLAWSVSPPPEPLYLDVPERVSARVGEPLQVPLKAGPASAGPLALSVEGALPAGVALDVAGGRLYGIPQRAGYSELVITARAPARASASAPLTIRIKPDPAWMATLRLRVDPEVEGRVGQALEVPLAVAPGTGPGPILAVVGQLPPGVSLDAAGKRLWGVPRAPGAYAVVLQASAPDCAPGWAALRFTIGEAPPPPASEARLSPAAPEGAPPSPAPVAEAPPSPPSAAAYRVMALPQPDRSGASASKARASGRVRRRGLAVRNGRP